MRKIVGYVRVSTEGQAQDGVSMDAQVAKIQAYAILNDCEQVEIYRDNGISGCGVEKRDGLKQALANLRDGDAFVVYSLSRLSRSTKDTITIADAIQGAGADLVSLSERIDTTTAAGKMVFRMLAVLNEFERDQVSERTKTAMQYKKAQGERIGSISYGYDLAADGKTLVENADEQAVIREVRELRESGLSYRKIADVLKRRGLVSRTGGGFHAAQIQRMAA